MTDEQIRSDLPSDDILKESDYSAQPDTGAQSENSAAEEESFAERSRSVISPRARERYLELSGEDPMRPGIGKCHIILSYSERYMDGTSREIERVTITQKPIVEIFRHAGWVNVNIDFRSITDSDLRMTWHLLHEFQRPINSVDWTEEELESGYYNDEQGNRRMIYFPYVEVALSPAGKETDFVIIGQNPAMFTLQPSDIGTEATVIQIVFPEGWLHVIENVRGGVDLNAIRDEVVAELAGEMLEAKSNLRYAIQNGEEPDTDDF